MRPSSSSVGSRTRSTLRVDVIKDRSTLSREIEGGLIANVYNLQVMNMTEKPRRYALSASGLDGIKITPTKEASWAGVRDKLANGELHAAHVLYGLVYGLHLGIGGPKKDMAVLMNLNHNGQAITLSKKLADKGAVNGAGLAKLMASEKREYTFAQTFPTGTHAMWLYYWLAAHGIDPMKDAKVITVPPPQMVANMRVGNMDGFCVGEPWNQRAIMDGIGVTASTTQAIWQDHPEKVLGTTAEFAQKYPNTARALTMAVLEASRFIDESEENKRGTAQLISGSDYVDAPLSAIQPRFLGQYEDGLGLAWLDAHPLRFFAGGEVNMPWLSDGIWFLTQFRRWGLLKDDPDYLGIARRIHRLDLYRSAAEALGIAVPEQPMRTSTLLDGSVWDGSDPAGYARSFAIHARADGAAAIAL